MYAFLPEIGVMRHTQSSTSSCGWLRFSRTASAACSEGLKVLTGGPLGTARYQGPR